MADRSERRRQQAGRDFNRSTYRSRSAPRSNEFASPSVSEDVNRRVGLLGAAGRTEGAGDPFQIDRQSIRQDLQLAGEKKRWA